MPKYYVNVKPIQVTIQANNPREAAVKVIRYHCRGRLPGPFTSVSETGFENDDHLFSTDEILGELYASGLL